MNRKLSQVNARRSLAWVELPRYHDGPRDSRENCSNAFFSRSIFAPFYYRSYRLDPLGVIFGFVGMKFSIWLWKDSLESIHLLFENIIYWTLLLLGLLLLHQIKHSLHNSRLYHVPLCQYHPSLVLEALLFPMGRYFVLWRRSFLVYFYLLCWVWRLTTTDVFIASKDIFRVGKRNQRFCRTFDWSHLKFTQVRWSYIVGTAWFSQSSKECANVRIHVYMNHFRTTSCDCWLRKKLWKCDK